MSIEDQIRYTQDIRRAALKQGKSVLQSLDKRGNINHAAEPLIFLSREDALAHQKANRHTLYSLYAGYVNVCNTPKTFKILDNNQLNQ